MERLKHFLKRLEALATDLQRRYTSDIFFRTTLYLVGLQATFVVLVVGIFAITLHYSNLRVARAVVTHIAGILQNNQTVTPDTLIRAINSVQADSTLLVFFGIVLLSILSGLILSYVTLRPTRNSLENQKLFISNIAHELRTPLAVVKTLAEVEMLDEKLSVSARETFASVLDEIDRASGVINNLLSLNRLLRPERIELTDTDLGPVVERVVARQRRSASERGIEILISKSDFCFVRGNAVALEQLVINLTNNALEYTPKHKDGKIVIALAPDYDGMMMFSVSDNGIGISQEDLFHIFEPFYRADKSRARNVKQGGSGLGLAIVNEIVRAHRGRIRIQSAPGKGTIVSVFLPVGHAPQEETQEVQRHTETFNEMAVDFSSGTSHGAAQHAQE